MLYLYELFSIPFAHPIVLTRPLNNGIRTNCKEFEIVLFMELSYL